MESAEDRAQQLSRLVAASADLIERVGLCRGSLWPGQLVGVSGWSDNSSVEDVVATLRAASDLMLDPEAFLSLTVSSFS